MIRPLPSRTRRARAIEVFALNAHLGTKNGGRHRVREYRAVTSANFAEFLQLNPVRDDVVTEERDPERYLAKFGPSCPSTNGWRPSTVGER